MLNKAWVILAAQNGSVKSVWQNMFSFENVKLTDVWQATLETLYMVGLSSIFVLVLGLLIGLLMYLTEPNRPLQNRFINFVVSAIVNIFRSIPFIILILLLIPFTKVIMQTMLGPKGAIPALVVSAAPFYARLVWIGLNEIPKGVIEASESMGASTTQIITKVLIPEALPSLISGLTVTAIAIIGYTAVAGAIGARGLGDYAYLIGYTRTKLDIVLVATIAILILVFIIQFIGDVATKLVDKR